ncbi:MAG: hypothetical protein AAGA45_04895, partial [Verrucomicrobiota bacterium]
MAATLDIEYNDNINGSTTNQLVDLIVTPGVSIDTAWRLTDYNSISFNIGLGYEYYTNNPELSSINNFLAISPDTQLAFTFFVENYEIEVFDRLDYSIDATDALRLDASGELVPNSERFGRFTNIAGINIEGDYNDIIAFMQFSRTDVLPTQQDFNFVQRTTYEISGGPRFLLSPQLTTGLTGGFTWTDYSAAQNNDRRSFFVGPLVIWQVSPLLSVQANFNYNWITIEQTGTVGDTSNPSGIQASVSASHRLSQRFLHSILYNRVIQEGFVSNATTTDTITYSASYRLSTQLTPKIEVS